MRYILLRRYGVFSYKGKGRTARRAQQLALDGNYDPLNQPKN